MNHVIVETIEDYNFYILKNRKFNNCFYSTNEQVILHLQSKKEKIHNIENFITHSNINNLGHISLKIQSVISKYLDNNFNIFENFKIGSSLGLNIYQTYFILSYKNLILENLIKNVEKNSKIICVGNPNLIDSADLYFSRFDNIYSYIIHNSLSQKIENLANIIDPILVKKKIEHAENIKLSYFEKLFSILDNSISSFLFKIFRIFPLTNFFFKKKRLFIYGYNEVIADLFIKLLKKKYNIKFLEKSKKKNNISINFKSEKFKIHIEKINKLIEKEFDNEDLNFEQFRTVTSLFVQKLIQAINYLNIQENQIKNYYEDVTHELNKDSIILSNGFYQLNDKLLYHYIKKKKSKIISFDHGLGPGMDKTRNYTDKFSGVIGDIGTFTSSRASKSLDNFFPKMKKIYIGHTDRYKDIFNIKKFCLKIFYNIKQNKKIIFIIAAPTRNNKFMGFYKVNDRVYIKKLKKFISIICKEKKNFTIILKLYPGARYYNEYDFEDLKYIPNFKVIRNTDFRWLRYMADINIITSHDSVLGQICACNADAYYLKYFNDPNNFKEALMNQNFFKLTNSLKLIDKKQIIEKRNLKPISIEI